MNKIQRRLAAIAAGGLGLGAIALAAAGPAMASVPGPTGANGTGSANAASSRPTAATDTCSSGFTKGWTSVDMVITNDSSQTLTFDPSLSGPSTGHWNKRPAATLAPGACEVVNAYAPTDVHIFYLNVMYTMPNGDYVPFSGIANATDPQSNAEVFLSQPTWVSSGDYWQGEVTGGDVIAEISDSGLLHTHYDLELH
jgi:hypothetical protein